MPPFFYSIFPIRYNNKVFGHEKLSLECYLIQESYSGKGVFNLNDSKGRQKKYPDQSVITL